MNQLIGEEIKAVVFDHDDTLVDTIGTKWAQHKLIAKNHYNKDLADDEIMRHWGKPLNELVCLLYGTDDVELATEHILACRDKFPKKLFPSTLNVLKSLRNAGLLLGIVTATSRSSFEHDLEVLEITDDMFNYIQTADDTQFHKPDPRVFEPTLTWLGEQGIARNQVIYIGDGLHDMHAATEAGFNFLGVETGLVTAKQFADNNARSIPSIASLLNS